MSAIEIRPSARQMRAPRLGRLFDSGTDALYTAFLTLDLIWRIGFRDRNKKVWCVAGAVVLGSPESLRSCREDLSEVPCGGVSRVIRPAVGDARSARWRRVGWRRGFAVDGLRFHQFHPRAVGVVEIALPFAVLHRHLRALYVPARTAGADLGLPLRLARFRRLPQREVAGVVLVVFVHLHT